MKPFGTIILFAAAGFALVGPALAQDRTGLFTGGATPVESVKKCCTNCTGNSCNTCNSPSKNPITGAQQCDALATKATCDDNGDNCKPGWKLVSGPGSTLRAN